MSKFFNQGSPEAVKAAIHAWCEAVAENNSDANVDELADHLHCEVERLVDEGMSPIDAFTMATEQMGDSDLLATEFSKNRNVVQKLLYAIQAFETANGTIDVTPTISPKKWAVITVANLILLAIVTFSVERILDDTTLFPEVGALLYMLWFGMFMIFYSASMPSAEHELTCLRRRITGLWKRS